MALIPPFFLDCVVAVGIDAGEGKRQWIASGFLYGHFLSKVDEKTNRYEVYLVTNRHVLEGQKVVYLRFNPRDAVPAREYTLQFAGVENPAVYSTHSDPDIDLAVVKIDANILDKDGIRFAFFKSDQHVADRKSLEDLGFTEGDFGYILGFPMGLVGAKRSFVIVRQGAIARIRDYLAGASKEILMDCMIFPGNSGGPAVTKPEAMSIQGTKSQSAAYLIGVVTQSISYRDVAISQQTKQPRVVFEDNSGLASIVPIQYLVELIQSLQPSPDIEEAQNNPE
jgi:S1-C subfamily serine protease